MFPFGKKNKAKIEVETAKFGGPIKRLRVLIGSGFLLGVFHAVEAYYGEDILPEWMEAELADLILNVLDLALAWFAYREIKPAIVKAADAQGHVEVAQVKADAGVKP